MKNGDTVAMVIAFFLVLPWLARLIVSAKAVWRALTEGSSMKKRNAPTKLMLLSTSVTDASQHTCMLECKCRRCPPA